MVEVRELFQSTVIISQAQFTFYINGDELVLNSFVLFFSVMGFGPVLLKIQKRILVSMN